MKQRRRERRGSSLHDQGGGMWVMEAVIFAILILASVAFVVTFETPTTQDQSFIGYLETLGQDSVDSWAAQAPSERGSPFQTRLEQYVAEALMGDDRNITEFLDTALPLGTMYRLTLETGNGTIFLAGEERPPPFTYPRAAASREMTLRPSGTFLETEFGIQDGLHALRPMAVVVENGRVVEPGAIPIEVRVTYEDGTNRTHTSVAYTSQAPSASVTVPSASLFFARSDNRPIGGFPMVSTVLEARLLLRENAPEASVPAGTDLTVRVPTGWDEVECPGDANVAWTGCDVTSYGVHGGGTIHATLLRPVNDETVVFRFNATYEDLGPTRLPFSAWRAELSGENAAVAELLVKPLDAHATNAASPFVGVTLPNPLGTGGDSEIVVTFANGGTDDVLLKEVELEALDGSPLWRLEPQPGWSLPSPETLRWNGDENVAARASFDVGASVRANAVVASSPYSRQTVPIEFDNEFRLDMTHFQRHAVAKDTVPAPTANSPGYPNELGPHWLRTRQGPFGNLSLEVAPLPESGLMSELYDAHVTSRLDVNKKQARPGQTVTLTADFTGVMETLVNEGNVGNRNVAVTTNVYSPISFLRKVPWATFETNEEALGHPPIWFMEYVDANRDGTVDLLLAKGKTVYALDGHNPDYDARLWQRAYAGNSNGLLALVDADGDGVTEALVVTASGEVQFLDLATGNVEQEYNLYQGVTAAAVGGDCDEDGRPELYVGGVKAAGKIAYGGPTFIGLDDLDLGAGENVEGWLHVLESDGARLLPQASIDLGTATKVRDFANGTLTANHLCAFVTAEANGDVTAYDGSRFEPMWTHESGVPFERGGATQVVIMETDPPGHPSHGVAEVAYGDGDGWVTALNSTRPAPVPRVLDLATALAGDEFVDVAMVSETDGYAVTKKGLVFKTTDGWLTALPVASNLATILLQGQEPTTVAAFDFHPSGSGIVAGADLSLHFTDDGGLVFETDQNRMLPGPAKDLQLYAPDAAVAAVDGSKGLFEIPKNSRELQFYVGWSGAASSVWVSDVGNGFAAGPHGAAAKFKAGQAENPVANISLGSHRHLLSILRFDGEPIATDDDGHIFYYDSAADSWTMKNLTSSPELNLTWLASSTGANLHTFNLDGARGFGLAERPSQLGSYRTQVSLDEPFVGISRGVDGSVAAATRTEIVAFPEPTAERRWSFPALGAVESLEATTDGTVGTGRLGAFRLEPALGNGYVFTPLDQDSLANFGRLRWFGPDWGWVAGTYSVGGGTVPVSVEPLPRRSLLTSQSNLVERYDGNGVVWSRPLPPESDADALAFALGDQLLVGQRGGSLLSLWQHNGNRAASTYPGDLTGTTIIPVTLPGQLLYGPYIAESQLRLKLENAGTDLIQTATVVNQFEVTPNGGPWSPRLYTLHLLVWPTV